MSLEELTQSRDIVKLFQTLWANLLIVLIIPIQTANIAILPNCIDSSNDSQLYPIILIIFIMLVYLIKPMMLPIPIINNIKKLFLLFCNA